MKKVPHIDGPPSHCRPAVLSRDLDLNFIVTFTALTSVQPAHIQLTHRRYLWLSRQFNMVRIKERYLLVNIIYPPDRAASSKEAVPDHVVQHQPTTDKLQHGTLAKAIKSEVASLFGDYGAGALESNLQGAFKCYNALPAS